MAEWSLAEIVRMLRSAYRYGEAVDVPEGSRVIHLSDTLALQMADYLEQFVEQESESEAMKWDRY